MRHILAMLCLLTTTGVTGVLTADAQAGDHRYSSHGGHSEHVRPHDSRARSYLAVENDRYSAVEVRADGRLLGTVAPETTQVFAVSKGGQTITVTSGPAVVMSRSTLFRPHETVQLDVPAYEGRLQVRNSTGRDGRLYIDGVDRGTIAANTDRTLILDPCSGAKIQIRSDRYTLDSKTVNIRSGKTTRFTAQAPALANVTIRNPLSVAIEVAVGSRGSITVMPGRTVTLSDVPVGLTSATMRLQGGRVIETARLDVKPYSGGKIVIEGPSAAAVAVHNIGRADARMWVDGTLVSRVDAYGDEVLDLSVGAHRVVVRDSGGNTLMDRTFTVTAFGVNEIVFGAASCPMPSDDRVFSASINW